MNIKKKNFGKPKKPVKKIRAFILSPERLNRLLDDAKEAISISAKKIAEQYRYDKYSVDIDSCLWRILPNPSLDGYIIEVPFTLRYRHLLTHKMKLKAGFYCEFE
jgi:hypothetical protein